ncbi:DUF3772 domain-containing protein [Celeribacter arenosi]|uniref:DUF3772 domain-containing protein n=1 Tax=Celeribacter arenosi TaxID=792649 RepID=A0ABP7KHG3_9RHOB
MRRFFAGWLLCLALFLGPTLGSAQDAVVPNYTGWEVVASEVESQLDLAQTSDTTLESFRKTLTDWRAEFLEAQSTNAARISTLQAQIAALGPVPEDATSESDEVAARREALQVRLDEALAPVRTAEEAYARADALITEIDTTLLAHQADMLTQRAPSPLLPSLWGGALSALGGTLSKAWATVRDNAASDSARETLSRNGLMIAFYLAVAMVLVARGRQWTERFTQSMRERVRGAAGQGVTGFVTSLSQIAVPVLGLFAFAEAAKSSGLLGQRAELLVQAVPQIGMAYFVARWVMGRLFFGTGSGDAVLDMTPKARREFVGQATLAGTLWALQNVITQLSTIDLYDIGTEAALTFPLILLGAFALYRIAVLLGRAARLPDPMPLDEDAPPQLEPSTGQGFVPLIARTVARALLVGSLLAVLLGALGYMTAAKAIIFPAILSLGLIGLLVVLSRLLGDIYGLITGQPDRARDALMPVLLSFALLLVSLPAFALIWGVREERLWELWARMREGVAIGEARVSVTDFLTFVVVFALGLAVTRLFKTALKTAVLPKTSLDKGGQNAMVAGAGYIGVFLSAIVAITAAGIDLSALAIVAGALSVGIGFGLQNIVQNFVSGIILLIERPISEGDWIEVGGQMGFVRDISVRSTRVETFDRTDVIVPNADLISGQVTNYTRGNLIGRVTVPVGVAYGTDTRRVEGILMEIARAHPMVTLNPEPQVHFIGFGADSLDFEIRAILRNVTFVMSVKSDLNHEIASRFAAENIEIPFAQRDVWLRNPEALRAPPQGDPQT